MARPITALSEGRLPWIAAVLLGAAVLLWFSLAVTAAQVSDDGAGLGWRSANQNASVAAHAVMQPANRDLSEARRAAQAALRREPVNVVAVRSLALIASRESKPTEAQRLIRYAETLSRRDLPTELWHIEERVQADDIAGALRHYDHALRASPSSDRQLIPILVKAASDPAIRRPLMAMVASKPPWWHGLANELAAAGQSPGAIFDLVTAMRLRVGNDEERRLLIAAMNRLIDLYAYRLAYRVYAESKQPSPDASLIRNGEFDSDNPLPPFDWRLAEEPDLAATVQSSGTQADGRALFFFSDRGRAGIVAQQLLLLPAGEYRLTAVVGEVPTEPAERPRLALICPHSSRTALFELAFPKTEAGPIRQDFRVPPDCAAQLLTVIAGSSLDQRVESWIDAISVRRL